VSSRVYVIACYSSTAKQYRPKIPSTFQSRVGKIWHRRWRRHFHHHKTDLERRREHNIIIADGFGIVVGSFEKHGRLDYWSCYFSLVRVATPLLHYSTRWFPSLTWSHFRTRVWSARYYWRSSDACLKRIGSSASH